MAARRLAMTDPTRLPPGHEIVFGPVPSRRLGRSLGIDHVPPKTCTYACTYCQLGPTMRMRVDRCAFAPPDELAAAVRAKLGALRWRGEAVDALTFVPAGEPTLDANLGTEIRALRPLGIPIAVIGNASLIWRSDVRADLVEADWVSLKVDAVDPAIWHALDRPHGSLELDAILDGACTFGRDFAGTLVTETMLVAGVNDDPEHLDAVARFLARLAPHTAYLSVPTRPPAVPGVRPPDEAAVNRAFQIFAARLPAVACLLGYEGNAFSASGDAETDLLGITAVHPMREDAVAELLRRSGADRAFLRRLVDEGRLVETRYGGSTFYVRRIKRLAT
jgi:wyosine [tRNA(Phe)-imidazoG37] synthetase (radical SAM superfamily)